MGGRPVSIKTSLRLSLMGALLAVVCTAMILHEFLRQRDVYRAAREKALVFTEAVAPQFAFPGPVPEAALRRRCQRLLEFPSVLGVSVWGRSDRPLARAAVVPELEDLLRELERPSRPSASIHAVHFPEGLAVAPGPVHLVFRPLAGRAGKGGASLLGLVLRMDAGAGAGHFWSFHLPMGLVGLGALCFGAWWLRRELVQPICTLVQALGSEEPEEEKAAPAPRHYELRLLAEGLSALRLDRSSWQQRARHTERRVDSRIAEQTQEIIRDLRRVQRQAWLDPLTGVHNRRFLQEKLPEMFAAQRESRRDLSLVMLDLDHFKNLNDTLGHAAGDELLRFVGELLSQCVRADDFAARYGGDEFVLILPGVSARDALCMANRILALFAQRVRMMFEVHPGPTLSAGIASICDNTPRNHRQLLHLADEALLTAKRSGKRRAHVSKSKGSGGRVPRGAGREPSARSTAVATHL